MNFFLISLILSLVMQQYEAGECQKEINPDDPKIYFLHVMSNIDNRYATTTVVSKIVNPANHSQEVFFHMNLPETAYINSFIMEINGIQYEAYIKEKEQAKKIYTQAVASGQSAGHVAVSSRDSNQFKISVNIEKEGKVKFILKYEELLERTLSQYKHVINLNPGQTVPDMKVEVNISEPSKIKNLFVPEIKVTNEIDTVVKENKQVVITRPNDNNAIIKYTPSVEDQENSGGKCFQGQFIVQYDVDSVQCGQVLVYDGYFVHFYAPDGLPSLNKLVVFVLDLSGSMYGRKLDQLKQAMSTILDELKENDFFTIVEFSFSVTVHNLDSASASAVISPHSWYGEEDSEQKLPSTQEIQQAYPATKHYVEKAKVVISKMSAGGGTNIYDALKTGIRISHEALQKIKTDKSITVIEPLIMFLTDGQPTVGTTDLYKINEMVNELNVPRSTLFALGFGYGADMNFLKKLSLRNSGFARKIYEASDAALQLKNFYKQISSPLLSNVTFSYLNDQVVDQTLTKKFFPKFFHGSELVVAGKVAEKDSTLESNVQSISQKGDEKCSTKSSKILDTEVKINDDSILPPTKEDKIEEYGPLERLWAYLTIKQLLEEKEKVEQEDKSKDEIEEIKKKALNLALKYKFVTPLTSLVVVKPNQTDSLSDLNESPAIGAGPPVRQSSPQYIRPGRPGGPVTFGLAARPASFEPPALMSPMYTSTLLAYPTTTVYFKNEEEEKTTENLTRRYSLSDLKWLADVFDTYNKTIIIPIGNSNSSFLIKSNPAAGTFQHCKSKQNLNGTCTHLASCVLPEIISTLQEYLDRFCPIQGGYAGVCCPDSYLSLIPMSSP
uniref:Secreted Inter-alpha trypsin inhibitor protein n=1 Tax=Pristhesancus plagipennis TaxID=1955184 RepID=A0A2K8JLS4_PRIPG|nr:secreted Inter-alpha trypsin inhibitor protein [Pristhesancus plagipennis]